MSLRLFFYVVSILFIIFENQIKIYMKNIKTKESSVCEPAIQYVPEPAVPNTMNIIIENSISTDLREKGYMTVSEYFEKVKKALNLRYENL